MFTVKTLKESGLSANLEERVEIEIRLIMVSYWMEVL